MPGDGGGRQVVVVVWSTGGGHVIIIDAAPRWHWPNGCLAMVAIIVVSHPLTHCWLWLSVSVGVVVVVVSTLSRSKWLGVVKW